MIPLTFLPSSSPEERERGQRSGGGKNPNSSRAPEQSEDLRAAVPITAIAKCLVIDVPYKVF